MAEEAKWYVIHTYSGYENKVASNLEKLVENRKMQDLIREVERKIFPGYVMVKMIVTNESWFVVRNIQGCTGFVGPASDPIPLTDDEVARLGVEKRSVEVGYKVGDNVKVIDGPLVDFTGIVDELDVKNNFVKITISMFGRETPVELEINQVKPVE